MLWNSHYQSALIFFHHLLVSHGAITPIWIFLTTFWGGYFSGGKASRATFAMEASGSLVKTKQRLECWWGLHLYPRLFSFALLHPRNLQEGPSVVEAFSSSLDECRANPAVCWVFWSVSVHAAEFLPSFLFEMSRACGLDKEAFFPPLRW